MIMLVSLIVKLKEFLFMFLLIFILFNDFCTSSIYSYACMHNAPCAVLCTCSTILNHMTVEFRTIKMA